jgi:hypothetical protein
MIKTLYKKYFQKSRSFLYPFLGIRKNSPFTPVQTFISMDEPPINVKDCKLICVFEPQEDTRYPHFEENMIINHILYSETIITPTGENIYIFDFSPLKTDWELFLKGKYSLLSDDFKKAIRLHYGASTQEYEYMDSYLFPERYFEIYAALLDIEIAMLRKVGELCDPYDEEQETFILSTINLETIS